MWNTLTDLRQRSATMAAWLSLGCIVSGCGHSGPPLYSVAGVVMCEGEPLANVDVYFEPRFSGQTAFGNTNSSGRYTLYHQSGRRGAEEGTYSIRVVFNPDRSALKELPPNSSAAAMRHAMEPTIYRLHAEHQNTVKPESNVIDLQVSLPQAPQQTRAMTRP